MALSIQRRNFLKAGAAFTTCYLLPSGSRAVTPNAKLRTAHVGVGGMGSSDLGSVSSHAAVEVAALCDVDVRNLDAVKVKHPQAATFRDYRELFAKMGDTIDAVVVSTPDHTHAPVAMAALNLGKPVYCQKPLTHEVHEARQLRLMAAKKGVPTQMGIQCHAHIAYRMATQMIQDGVIGPVSRVYAWSGKNWGYDGPAFQGEDPVPENLDWNLWVGSAAMRPFKNGVYHPGNWRKMVDFGTGTLGDMGVHIFDTPYRALKLTAPKWVKTTCRPPTGVGHPEKNVVEYEFPGTAYTTDSLRWTWFDGAYVPPQHEDLTLPEDRKLPGQGSMFIGEKGRLLLPHVGGPQLFPVDTFRTIERPKLESVNHYHQWVEACLGNGKPSADFDYAGRLTEALLLGVVANRFPDTKLIWDAGAMRVTNMPEADKLLKRPYRDGFHTPGL